MCECVWCVDRRHWGSNPEPSSLESRVRLTLIMTFSSCIFSCPVVTLRYCTTNTCTVVHVFVVRYYDYIILTGRRPSWLVKVLISYWVLFSVGLHHRSDCDVIPHKEVHIWSFLQSGLTSTGCSWYDICTVNLILSDTCEAL